MESVNPNRLWQAALGELELQMTRATFDTWLRDTRCLGCEAEDTLVIGVKNGYAVAWLQNRLYPHIRRTLYRLAGKEMHAQFVVWEGKRLPESTPALLESIDAPAPLETIDPGLNRHYNFQSFVVGPGNRLAQAASQAVAETPAKAYNPLFVHGGVGLGKTHLLHAIGLECYRRKMRVMYTTSETFTNELIEAIRTHTTDAFRDRYRTADVLLVDDIQFIAGKESTQEEFFHTFNALRDTGRQIVLSSDRAPKAMVTLEARLRSRFEWGLLVDVQPPDFETRVAILSTKAEQLQVKVPNDVLHYIANSIASNIRELEGALNRTLAMTNLTGMPLTIETVKQAIGALLPNRPELDPTTILQTVASYYSLSIDDLRSPNRSQRVALPRHMAMYLLREETDFSLPQIGAQLGGRDHTTILYGYERIRVQIEENDQIRRDALTLKSQLYTHN